MCGIIGLFPYEDLSKKAEKVRQESMIFLTTELLQLTQPRGKEATGIFTLYDDCNFTGLKMGVSATEFINRFDDTKESYKGFVNEWRKHMAKIVIGHCRKPSTGFGATANNNDNNHPLRAGRIVGVHNGTLDNSDEIFRRLKCERTGKVDSEAIFRLLSHLTHDGTEPFTMDILKETYRRIKGPAAVLALNVDNPYQLAAIRDTRPLEGLLIKPLKLLLLASDKDFLQSVVFRYNKQANLYHGGKTGFLPLTQDDIDIEKFEDDSIYLFDNRLEITKDTTVSDLYASEKLVRTDKIWEEKKATSYHGKRYSGTHTSRNGTGTQGNNIAVSHKKSKTPKPGNKKKGMVYDKSAGKYKNTSEEDLELANSDGTVELDCDNKSITHITPGVSGSHPPMLPEKTGGYNKEEKKSESPDGSGVFLSQSERELDTLLYESVTIVEIPPDEKPEVESKVKPVEISMKTKDSELMARATMAMNKVPPFTSNLELIDAIDVTSLRVLKTMDFYPLANRIKRSFYRDGFYDGFKTAQAELNTNIPLRIVAEKHKQKHQKAKKRVSNLKSFTFMLSSFINTILGNCENEPEISSVLEEAKRMGLTVDLGMINSTFSKGDKLRHPTIKALLNGLEVEELEKVAKALERKKDNDVCIACGGTGISSFGGSCIACEDKRWKEKVRKTISKEEK